MSQMVKFGEESWPPRTIKQRVDVRQRLHRRARHSIQAPVVVADARRPVRLTREHHRRRMPRGRVLNPAAVEQVNQLRALLCKLAVGRALHRAWPRHRRLACLELELHAAVWWHACWGPEQHVRRSAYRTLSTANAGSSAPSRCSSASARQKDARCRESCIENMSLVQKRVIGRLSVIERATKLFGEKAAIPAIHSRTWEVGCWPHIKALNAALYRSSSVRVLTIFSWDAGCAATLQAATRELVGDVFHSFKVNICHYITT